MKEGNVMKKREGSALAFTIIIMVVITILSGIILQIAMAETMQAKRDKDRIEAYYVAKSGAEATADWILKNSTNAKNIIGKESVAQNLANGIFEVEVKGTETSPEIIVQGTGTVRGVSQKASLILNRTTNLTGINFDYALYAGTNMDLRGDITIDGKVGYGNNFDPHGNNVTVSSKEKITINYPTPIAPTDPSLANDFSSPDPKILFSSTNRTKTYRNLVIDTKNDNEFIIDTGSVGLGDANLVLETLTLTGNNKGNLKITGENRLNIYITKYASFSVNVNKTNPAKPENLLLMMCEGSSITFVNKIEFNGFIYAPTLSITDGGNLDFRGAIISKNLDLKENPFVSGYTYDPINGGIGGIPVQLYSKGRWIE